MRKIDIHCHVIAFPEYSSTRPNGENFLSAEKQIEIHNKLEVEFGVILPLVSPEGRWSTMSNEETQYVVNKYPERFTWFCNVDPRQGSYGPKSNLSHILGQYKEKGAKGVGEITAALYADDDMMQNLFSSCEELDMPVLFHLSTKPGAGYGMIDDLGLPRLEKMLRKYPNLKFIGHSQPFWCEISADVTEETRKLCSTTKVIEGRVSKLMREYGNLYCDISAGSGRAAMVRDPEFTSGFLAEFSDRVLYGSDVSKPGNTFQYELVNFLENLYRSGSMSLETYEKICYKNAEKLLGINVI